MGGGMLHHLGQVCRAARVEAGLRQIDIATSAETSHVTISRFETGQTWPIAPEKVISAYATELGATELDLWTLAVSQWQHAVRADGEEPPAPTPAD